LRQIEIIQALRFFGAVVIFTAHTKWFLPSGGYAVELFTMISGYIIIYSTQKEQSKRAFLTKRIIRIVPLYWLLTIFMYIILCIRPSLSISSVANPKNLVKSLLFIPFVNSKGYDIPILGVGWTLNYEMLFYIIFYFAMLLNHKFRAFLTIAGIVLLVAGGRLFHPKNFILQYYTDTFLLEFAMGILAYYLVEYLQPKIKTHARLVCGFIACLAFLWLILDPHTNETLPRCVCSGIPAFICISAALLAWNSSRLPPILVKLGDITYSFYFIELFTAKFFWLSTKNLSLIMQLISFFTLLGITLLCAYVSYQIVEIRFTGFLKKKLLYGYVKENS